MFDERVATQILDQTRLMPPGRKLLVPLPLAQVFFGNTQAQSGLRLVDSKIEAAFFQMLADGGGFVRDREAARPVKGIWLSGHGYGPFTKRQSRATGRNLP